MNLPVLLAGLAVLFISLTLEAAPRDTAWKKVAEARDQGLPRSALEALEPIVQSALRDKAWGEAARAIAEKVTLEASLEGNAPEERLKRMEALLPGLPEPVRPVLLTLVADWYWEYFQVNRWRYLQRTQVAGTEGADITTWSLPRILREIDARFRAALAQAPVLQRIPIADYQDILTKGTLPDRYRPTLFDFVAYQALAFYQSGEQAAALPEGAFNLEASSPIFDSVDAFLAWEPSTASLAADQSPPELPLQAIKLYQQLLRFHRADPSPAAFLEADSERLKYGFNAGVGPAKNQRYLAALRQFIERCGDDPIITLGLHEWARVLRDEDKLAEAHAIATRGAGLHPGSPGTLLCRNLVLELEVPSVSIATERIWSNPRPDIQVRYRNIERVWFRLIPIEWTSLCRDGGPFLNTERQEVLLKRPPAKEWSQPLPDSKDFREHTAGFAAPADLKPGGYFLFASHRADFLAHSNSLASVNIWVSNLGVVTGIGSGRVGGLAVDAPSGEPLQDVVLELWDQDGKNTWAPSAQTTTDEVGRFEFPKREGRPVWPVLLRARLGGDEMVTPVGNWPSERSPRPRAEQTFFFTDRAIYRPGQPIQFKGLCFVVNASNDQYETLAGREVTVAFRDPNGKEIARETFRANDYGSFAGSFLAPRDRLMGRMSLAVMKGPAGTTGIQVEEYKRPKFQVALEAPKEAPRLGNRVSLPGRALAYTGAAIDGAKVAYRVVREVRWPIWWWWGPPPSPSQQLAHGTTTTRADGSFEIPFVAEPDPSVQESDEPTFVFSIWVDITDNSGETRSDRRQILVAYTALQAAISADSWLTASDPTLLRVRTESLDGEPQAAEGVLRIFKLPEPATVKRSSLVNLAPPTPTPNEADGDLAALGAPTLERGFTTGTNGTTQLSVMLGVGRYRGVLQTQDRFGRKVIAQLRLQVIDPAAEHLDLKEASFLDAPRWQVEPGATFVAVWGTGYSTGRAFVRVETNGVPVTSFWTQPGRTQQEIRVPVTDAMRGGFTLQVIQVRENVPYIHVRQVAVPWKDKELVLSWEHFTSKLEPGQKETWTAVIKRNAPGGQALESAVAEMVATLYDASLNTFAQLNWPSWGHLFRRERIPTHPGFSNQGEHLQLFVQDWPLNLSPVEVTHRTFIPEILDQSVGGSAAFVRHASARGRMVMFSQSAMMMDAASATNGVVLEKLALTASLAAAPAAAEAPPQEEPPAATSPAQVSPRRNLNETAFFLPQLVSDSNGTVRLSFTMPEALTEWRFLGFAHDRELRSGQLEGSTVTARELMVQPNPPRFLREGDELEFAVKVSNQSGARQQGTVRLSLANALTGAPADTALGLLQPDIPFDIPPKESRSFNWRLRVPDGQGFLTYKATAATSRLTDGEEGNLPILSRRVFITESMPLPVRGPATNTFHFTRLAESGKSRTLQHQSLTVQMASNPAWYAVLALPYLMEYPYQCSEQTFNRYYANTLSRHIAQSNPKIHQVFEQWRNTPALDSPLERNQDLKSVVLEETPWVRDSADESQARRNLGLLFDDARLTAEADRAMSELRERQLPDGAWAWFPGGPANDYITLYITTGFGRLRHLGVDAPLDPAIRSLDRLDLWINRHYQDLKDRNQLTHTNLNPLIALFLYGRSFFLQDKPVADASREAVDYFLGQARSHWLALGDRQSQGHVALALHRFNQPEPARAILKSLRERAVTDPELGMFWRDPQPGWWWWQAPIESQALMIEAFDEVTQDLQAVEECRVWLLKQKQARDWKTTKATADAVYALLLRGSDFLAADTLVQVELGGMNVTPQAPGAAEAGTGFFSKRFPAAEVTPKFADVRVRKSDPGVAWGAVHWQYLEDVNQVKGYEGTPLKLAKSLFTKVTTAAGPELRPLTGPVAVGDELVTRIELRVDRDMDYVHLKDQRGSGTEPVNVLSGYRYQDALGYYETTRDTATHFFMDHLPRGTYVLEYSVRVQHRGRYPSGVAEAQCMYAPEFNSHSASTMIEVGP